MARKPLREMPFVHIEDGQIVAVVGGIAGLLGGKVISRSATHRGTA